MFKRTLCLLLALLAIAGNLPVFAYATEEEPTETLFAEIETVDFLDGSGVGMASSLASSAYYQYYYADGTMYESEKNNSRGSADVLPVSSYQHIAVSGQMNSRSDSKDYYKFTVTDTMYLKLMIISGHSKKHSSFGLYDSDGDKLKSVSYKEKLTGDKDTVYFLQTAVNPGTYYIRAYEPKKSGYYSYGSAYLLFFHLYPRLDKPVVTTSGSKVTGKPIVNWNRVPDAAYYKVYRATSKGGTYYEKATVYDTTWTDEAAKAGKTYYYKVQAFTNSSYYADSNYESSKSSYKARTCDCAAPVVEGSFKNGKPYLDWEKISGAVKYKVYRATSLDGEYKLVKTTEKTAFTDTKAKSGKVYYYKVKACAKKSSANSATPYIYSFDLNG